MPGSAPVGWQAPKVDWEANDVVASSDMNRGEGNPAAIETGNRTIDPAEAPPGNVGTLRQLLDWIANRFAAHAGGGKLWHEAPDTTLASAKGHIDAAAPHSGHETPTGAQSKVDTHAGLTTAHSATSAATASRIAIRDAAGRTKVVDGAAADDAATKGQVDTHAALTSPHSATSAATADRIVLRDASGRAKVVAPSATDDIAQKAQVDAVQTDLNGKMNAATGHKHTGAAGDAPKIPCTSLTGVQAGQTIEPIVPLSGFTSTPFVLAQDMIAQKPIAPTSVSSTQIDFSNATLPAGSSMIRSSFASPSAQPAGLAWDGTYLWNADSAADKIFKLSTLGAIQSSFASPNTEPVGLAWDGTYLWNAAELVHKIFKLSTAGVIQSSFASPGTMPRGLTWDGTYLWNIDGGDDKIFKLSTAGVIQSSFAISGGSWGLAWDSTYLWCTGFDVVDKIFKLSTLGAIQSSFASPDTTPTGLEYVYPYVWNADDVNKIFELYVTPAVRYVAMQV